jgi:elongation factor P--(R)-beta-lysine ligase
MNSPTRPSTSGAIARRTRPSLPLDHRFLQALRAGMPDAAGVAVGLDRVVMLAAGAATIDDVLAFPLERA